MAQTLLLVDYENVPRVDLSVLDDSYRAIIFVGKSQQPPKAARNKHTAHRFTRVDFLKIDGHGRNALDFHIAFHLGRVFETAPATECVVIAKDKGYDPLLRHLNNNGGKCRRVESWEELMAERNQATKPLASPSPTVPAETTKEIAAPDPEMTVCPRCKKVSTIAHHGGRWCSNCGSFAVAPDPKLLPSKGMPNTRSAANGGRSLTSETRADSFFFECGWCHQRRDMTGGIYDDGEWMCGHCIARYAT